MKKLLKTPLLAFLLFNASTNENRNINQSPTQSKLEILSQSVQRDESSNQKNLSSLVSYMKSKGFGIDSLISDKRFQVYEEIQGRFTQSAERKSRSLEEYKKIFNFEDKKKKIPIFMEKNSRHLKKAEETYGVPKEIISAIIGIESNFGAGTGRYNPFNAYASMYIKGYRKDFAKTQLEELLIFCKRNGINVFDLKSSYAGAMSYAQFIPSSLNRWFVGSDLYSMEKNILSVANYISHFKKRTKSMEESVYRYNPSKLYVGIVMALAKEAKDDSNR